MRSKRWNLPNGNGNEEIYTIKYLIIIEKFIEEQWMVWCSEKKRKRQRSGRKKRQWQKRSRKKNYLYFIYFMWIPQCSYVNARREIENERTVANPTKSAETSFERVETANIHPKWAQNVFDIHTRKSTHSQSLWFARTHTHLVPCNRNTCTGVRLPS